MSDTPIITFAFWVKAFIPAEVPLSKNLVNSVPSLFFLFPIVLMLSLTPIGCSAFQTKTSKYVIPKDYVGWVRVYYGIKNAPTLPVSDDGLTYIHKIQPDGKLITSTIIDGSRLKFFIDDKGRESDITSSNLPHDFQSGTYQIPCVILNEKDDKDCQSLSLNYTWFFFGTDEQFKEARKSLSSTDFSFQDKLRDNDLKEFISPLDQKDSH